MGWEDELRQTLSKSAEQTTKTRKITSSQTTAQYFLKLASQKRNGANHLTFQLEFPEISK